MCISYLFLRNKLLQNIAAEYNTHLLSHSFYGTGIYTQRNCILCFRVSPKAAIKESAQAAVSSEGWTEEVPTSKFMWLFHLKNIYFQLYWDIIGIKFALV